MHLNAGKIVVKLAIKYNDRLSCVLSDYVSIRRLKFLDVIQEEAAEVEAEDAAARFPAGDFSPF